MRFGVVLCGLVLAGCSSGGTTKDAGASSVLVVGTRSFTAAELDSLIARQPEILRARYSVEPGRSEFIDQLIQSELLVQEAKRRGLDQDPEVQSLVERLMIQRLAESVVPPAPTEDALRAAYDEGKAEFVRPDRLHVRAILFAGPKGAPSREKAKLEAEGASTRLRAVKEQERDSKFEDLARQRSDEPNSRAAGGDLGPRTPDELAAVLGSGVQAGVSTLLQPGQVSTAIETERGFVVVLLRGVQPGLTQTYESVRPRLEQRLMAEARASSLKALVSKLRAEAEVRRVDARP